MPARIAGRIGVVRVDNKCRIVFVSRLNQTRASHRFRVFKLLTRLQNNGIGTQLIHIDRSGIPAIPKLLLTLLRHPCSGHLVVFQKSQSRVLAYLAKLFKARVIMDLDDGGDVRIDGSKLPGKPIDDLGRWIENMDAMVVSTEHLALWVSQWNSHIYIVPTCLDTEAYSDLRPGFRESCTIGWIGGFEAQSILHPIEPALMAVQQSTNCKLLIIAGSQPLLSSDLLYEFVPWQLELEPSVFGQLDIGIMPLPANDRARNKAGFKLIQYMAAGLPVVASSIGYNRKLITHGENGFLADTLADWQKYLEKLVSDPNLRKQMGNAGRQFVTRNYNLDVAAQLWSEVCRAELGNDCESDMTRR